MRVRRLPDAAAAAKRRGSTIGRINVAISEECGMATTPTSAMIGRAASDASCSDATPSSKNTAAIGCRRHVDTTADR
jgi:hypothetical protein